MIPRSLSFLLLAAMVALPSCGGQTKKKAPVAATVSGTGPVVTTGKIPPAPKPPIPNADQTVYVGKVIDSASGNPIGGVRCMLLRNIPEPEYMRKPARRDVMWEYKTPLHGTAIATINHTPEEPKDMKYFHISGPGFYPFYVEAGEMIGGKTHEFTVKATITPQVKFVVRMPNGDRAKNAICTLKPDSDEPVVEGKMAERGTASGNIGTTERADDLGEVTFNRKPGTYRLYFSAETGKHRHYEKFVWSGSQDKPVEIKLPAQSMEKPW